MGSYIEINDTLQIDRSQGFPEELNLEKHLDNPYHADDFEGKTFKFKGKKDIRFYQMPPIRVFLVENRDGKWIYWGLIHILSLELDYKDKSTSGEYKIEYIYTPDEMKKAHDLIDRNADTNYFSE